MAKAPTEIGGIDSGLFYSIIYFTVASIINILVCVLAARDTYKRVQKANKESPKKWRIPNDAKRSTALQQIDEILDAHSTTNLTSPSSNINTNNSQNDEKPINYAKISSLPLHYEEPSAEFGTKSENENDTEEPPYPAQLTVSLDHESTNPPKQPSISLEHPPKISPQRINTKSITTGVHTLPTTPTAGGNTPNTPIEITKQERMPRLNNCWFVMLIHLYNLTIYIYNGQNM